MKRLRYFTAVAAMLAIVLSFSGCDDSNSGNDGNGTNQSSDNPFNTDNTDTSDTSADPILDLSLEIVNTTVTKSYLIDESGDARSFNYYSGIGDTVLNDIRSITETSTTLIGNSTTLFLIKNDNSLWAVGSNLNGRLGDNTAVDKEEPVKILDNVANIYGQNGMSAVIYAITNDNVLYRWGDGVYKPEKIFDDVVIYCGYQHFIKKDGSLWAFNEIEDELISERIMGNVIHAEIAHHFNWMNGPKLLFIIKGDNSLHDIDGEKSDKILDDVAQITIIDLKESEKSVMIIKNDNSLWGWGTNTEGQLGDGTKINREEPVKIADNVVSVSEWSYVDGDGNVWEWNYDNPVPAIVE